MKNAARRVRPAAIANFPRAESAFCTAAASVMAFARRARRAILPVATKFHGAFCTERGATGFSQRLRSGVGASEERCPARKAAAFCKLFACGGAIGAAGGTSSAPVSPTSRAQRARLQAARIMVFARRARRAICRLPRSFTARFAWTRRSGIFPATAQRSGCERSPALPGRETHRPRACFEKEKTCNGGGRSAGFSEACAGFVAQSPEFAAP